MILDNEGITLPYDPAWNLFNRIIRAMSNSPHKFYLTGSYYFGCPRPDSDVDFIAQDTPEVRQWLQLNDFYSLLSGSYVKDSILTAEVFESGIIQVQLAHDIEHKRKVRDFIRTNNAEWHRHAGRDQRNWLWNSVGEVLDPAKYCPNFEPLPF